MRKELSLSSTAKPTPSPIPASIEMGTQSSGLTTIIAAKRVLFSHHNDSREGACKCPNYAARRPVRDDARQ